MGSMDYRCFCFECLVELITFLGVLQCQSGFRMRNAQPKLASFSFLFSFPSPSLSILFFIFLSTVCAEH